MNDIILIFLGAAIINNFVLYKFLGICPFLGVSNKTRNAVSMGLAVTFTMVIASIVTWLIQNLILVPLHLEFLQIVSFILVVASLVQLIEMFISATLPALHKAFGIFLPLITTNCAILGVTILNVMNNYNFVESIVYSFGAGAGFLMALVIMSGIRERLELADTPAALRGVPIALIVAGILALAFGGFGGMM